MPTDARTVEHDYSGRFRPDWTLEQLSRASLARLCREYMLVSMLHDRSLMPHLAALGGMAASVTQADDEWMAASPIYTERNKRNLRIDGNGAAEVLKSFQFDVGMPHHFLDFHGEVFDHDHAIFWLPTCGAHDYVRRLTGNETRSVQMLCHLMEDNTFDATLKQTNPRARAIPVHRPPHPAAHQGERCRWEVRLLDSTEPPREDNPNLEVLSSSLAADFRFELGKSFEAGGLEDYSGEFVPGLRLEDFSHRVLVRQAKEFALDVHLLMRAAYLSLERRHGTDVLWSLASQHLAALTPALVTRLQRALGIEGDSIETIAKLLQVNPLLPPDYVRYRVELVDERRARISFEDCAGLADTDTPSPLGILDLPEGPGFEHVAQAVNPKARVHRLAGPAPAWDVVIDSDAEPIEAHPLAELVGADDYLDTDLGVRPVPVMLRRRGS